VDDWCTIAAGRWKSRIQSR